MNKNIKRAAALIIAFITALLCCGTCFGEEPLSASVIAGNVNVGDTFEVRVALGPNGGFGNGSFNVIYDNNKVELVSATSDTEMMKGVLYVINDKYAENAVRISFAAAFNFGNDGGDLMVLTFKAIGAGQAAFTVEKLKLMLEGEKYATIDSSSVITISGGEITTRTVTAAPVHSTSSDTSATASSTQIASVTSKTSSAAPITEPSATKGSQADSSVTSAVTQTKASETVSDTETGAQTSASVSATESDQTSTSAIASTPSSTASETKGESENPVPMQEKKSSSNSIILIVVIAVIVIAAALIILITKKSKHK